MIEPRLMRNQAHDDGDQFIHIRVASADGIYIFVPQPYGRCCVETYCHTNRNRTTSGSPLTSALGRAGMNGAICCHCSFARSTNHISSHINPRIAVLRQALISFCLQCSEAVPRMAARAGPPRSDHYQESFLLTRSAKALSIATSLLQYVL